MVLRTFVIFNVLMLIPFLTSCQTSFEDVWSSTSDQETKTFWKIGYNEVRFSAPIHIHFAEELPSPYSGVDASWDWKLWEKETVTLLKEELFPLLGAYEHYYFLIDYKGYDSDDEKIVQLTSRVGNIQNLSKDGFTGISGMHIKESGWRVPLHMSRIPDDDPCHRPEGCLRDRLRSSVIHEYHHVMMWHQMMNNYQSQNSGGTIAEPDYCPPWFSEGAAAVLPFLMGAEGGRDELRNRIQHVLDKVRKDSTLDFEHMKSWETWTKPPLSFEPFLPLACYMAIQTSWQMALVDVFRAMGLQPYPGDFDALLIATVGVNEHDFLNDALSFFRLESTTADTLMPPDLPVDEILSPPSLKRLSE